MSRANSSTPASAPNAMMTTPAKSITSLMMKTMSC